MLDLPSEIWVPVGFTAGGTAAAFESELDEFDAVVDSLLPLLLSPPPPPPPVLSPEHGATGGGAMQFAMTAPIAINPQTPRIRVLIVSSF
jgi:hypothetical protein